MNDVKDLTQLAMQFRVITAEDRFFAQLLTPNVIELEQYWREHGLDYRDFVTILMDRAKMSRGTIEKALTVLYRLQNQVETAKRLSQFGPAAEGDELQDD